MAFDCSDEFHEISINNKLLSVLVLTNQLIGILVRFRREQVAVIEYIECKFCQVWLSFEHKSLLNILWQKDGYLSNPPIDYKMGRHAFDGVSSPICSNYALKKTADDNKLNYGPEAADTLKESFYVDDMLKSVASVSEAIILIKNVRRMCVAGGFRLHNFLSNRKKLLMSIPRADIQEEAPNKKLIETLLQMEQHRLYFRILKMRNWDFQYT